MFTDMDDAYDNNNTSTSYLYFWTEPRLETASNVTTTYIIEAIYSKTPNVEITLNGNETMTLNVGDSFVDPGATTDTDGVTATVTVTDADGVVLSSVDTSVVGTYTLTYSAAGATQDKVRTVTVLPTVQNVSTHTVKNQPTSFFLKYNGL